jgi:hypothetical protein
MIMDKCYYIVNCFSLKNMVMDKYYLFLYKYLFLVMITYTYLHCFAWNIQFGKSLISNKVFQITLLTASINIIRELILELQVKFGY